MGENFKTLYKKVENNNEGFVLGSTFAYCEIIPKRNPRDRWEKTVHILPTGR